MTALQEAPARLYRSPWGLLPFQQDLVLQCLVRPACLVVADTGLGKMAPISEPVLTPSGWKTMGNLIAGDFVIGSDGHPTEVLGVYPQGVQPVWRVWLSDGTFARCGRDHLWAVRTKVQKYRQQPFRVMTTEAISESLHRDWQLPMVAPIQHDAVDLPVDPYALGVLLGDGSMVNNHVVACTDNWIGQSLGWSKTKDHKTASEIGYWKADSKSISGLQSLGMIGHRAWEKGVPRDYLHSPEEQRRALLAGLMDTDGYAMPDGGAEFSSTSRALVDAVCELVRSLGGVARGLRVAASTYDWNGEKRRGREAWRVNIKIADNPFRLPRKASQYVLPSKYAPARIIRQVEDEGVSEAQVCIRVAAPDSLYVTRDHIVTHNTHVDLATAAILFEDDDIDIHLLVCEQNKVDEWEKDFAKYTDLRVARYYGPGARRKKVRDSLTSAKPVKVGRAKTEVLYRPQVLISTFETFRNDMATKAKEVNAKGREVIRLVPGPLSLALTGMRVLVGYDEMTKLGNRGSDNHKAHALFLNHVRTTGGMAKPIGLTATPIERSPENYYNLGRILCPEEVGTVESFTTNYVASYDAFGNANRFKNLTVEDRTEPWVTPLAEKMRPVLLRKRKTDPDVIDQFPATSEKFIHVDLGDRHQEFYEVVRDTFAGADDYTQRQVITTLRQIAGHPLSLLHSQAEASKIIVEKVGEAGLAALGSAKLDMLVGRLKPLILGQGAQAVVFGFFGPSMLPLIGRRLEDEGITVAYNFPAIGDKVRAEHKAEFKEGNRRVFLTSDAGARGINLPEASYVFEYESALTHANRVQRFNRIHRIDSKELHGRDKVWFYTLIARHTCEEGIINNALKRNDWSDRLLDDDDPGEAFVTASMRRAWLKISKAA